MKKGFKIFLIIVVLVIALFIGVIVFDTINQESALQKEFDKTMQKDLLKDDFDNKVITTGDYAIVEKTIKDYLKDYSDTSKDLINNINKFDFENMFSASTFKSDGPEFIKSKEKLSKLQITIKNDFDKLIKMNDKKYINSLIKNKNLDDYYIDLYKEYMYGDNSSSVKKELENSKKELQKMNTTFNDFLDDCYKIYDFMSTNRNSWSINGDTVYFNDQSLLSEYNSLTNKIIENINLLDNETSNI